MCGCMNVMNSPFKSMEYMNIKNWAYYEAEYALHVFKVLSLVWFQTNHTLEHSMVQLMETLETITAFLNFHKLKRLQQDAYFQQLEPLIPAF